MTLLDTVKLDLGISTTKKDESVQATIDAAILDMNKHGVRINGDMDPLKEQCIKLFCRAWYNFQGDGERYNMLYEKLADSMALDTDYNTIT